MSEIKNRMTLDSKPFTSELDKALGRVNGFASKAGKMIAGAFAARAVIGFAEAALAAADEVDNLAKQTGLGVETVQSLQVVAKEAGLSFGEFQAALMKVGAQQAQAINGNKASQDSFAALGISMARLSEMSLEETLEAVGQGMKENSGTAAATTAANMLLGESSLKLRDALISASEDGFEALNARMRDSGQIMDTNLIGRLDEIEERLSRNKTAARNFGAQVLDAFLVGAVAIGTYAKEIAKLNSIEGAAQAALSAAMGPTATGGTSPTGAPEVDAFAQSPAQQAFIEFQRRVDIQKKSNADQIRFFEEERRQFEFGAQNAETYEMRLDYLRKMVDAEKEITRLQDAEFKKAQEAQARESQAAKLRTEETYKQLDAANEAAKELAEIQSGEGVSGLSYGTGAGLEKIGGFSGGGTSGVQTSLDRQIRIQEQIREFNRRMADSLERNQPLTVGGI